MIRSGHPHHIGALFYNPLPRDRVLDYRRAIPITFSRHSDRSRASVLVIGDREHPRDRVVERDERLRADNSGYDLEFVVEQFHQMLIVPGKELDKHRVGPGSEMTFHDFGYLDELGHHLAIQGSALEVDSYKCACAVAEDLGIYILARARDDIEIDHALYALMDRRTRHATFLGYVLGSDACIAHYYIEYLSI